MIVQSRACGPVEVDVVGTVSTGIVWLPVWLVWDRPDALWWIQDDPEIHPGGRSLSDSRNFFAVPRPKWEARMSTAA
jgi:hypothetical protein